MWSRSALRDTEHFRTLRACVDDPEGTIRTMTETRAADLAARPGAAFRGRSEAPL